MHFSLVHGQMWWRGVWNWPGVCYVVVRISKASPPIMRWSCCCCCCIPGHLIRSCWYHRRCHQPFQALNRWCPLFLRSCQCPLCGSWENDLTHRQLLSAAWVILYSHFYWGGLSRTYHCKQGVKPPYLGPWIASECGTNMFWLQHNSCYGCVFNALCKDNGKTSTLEILMPQC